MHNKFMNSDEFLKAYDIESERLFLRRKTKICREEGWIVSYEGIWFYLK